MKYLLVCLTYLYSINICSAIESDHGVELYAPIFLSGGDYISVGYNYFNYAQGYEIAIPVVYRNYKFHGRDVNNQKTYNVDIIFRWHDLEMAKQRNKYSYLFIGVFPRISYLTGDFYDDERYLFSTVKNSKKVMRYGYGINIGYKRFFTQFNQQFYWGASISFGEYITKPINADNASSTIGYSGNKFIDVEFAKFGYIF